MVSADLMGAQVRLRDMVRISTADVFEQQGRKTEMLGMLYEHALNPKRHPSPDVYIRNAMSQERLDPD